MPPTGIAHARPFLLGKPFPKLKHTFTNSAMEIVLIEQGSNYLFNKCISLVGASNNLYRLASVSDTYRKQQ